ncbi:hypothetical protein A9996_01570 [Gelidibacter algens]|nr:hypothetical protein A9996_01570 [Gelidibacter algens]
MFVFHKTCANRLSRIRAGSQRANFKWILNQNSTILDCAQIEVFQNFLGESLKAKFSFYKTDTINFVQLANNL